MLLWLSCLGWLSSSGGGAAHPQLCIFQRKNTFSQQQKCVTTSSFAFFHRKNTFSQKKGMTHPQLRISQRKSNVFVKKTRPQPKKNFLPGFARHLRLLVCKAGPAKKI